MLKTNFPKNCVRTQPWLLSVTRIVTRNGDDLQKLNSYISGFRGKRNLGRRVTFGGKRWTTYVAAYTGE